MSFRKERRQNNDFGSSQDKKGKLTETSRMLKIIRFFHQGSFIEQDDYVYIREILNNMRDNADDSEQTMMADNFFENSVDKELSFSSNAVASKALEIVGESFTT